MVIEMIILDPKSELVQRSVYEFFQMLADIGGFNDGLQILLSFIMLAYNSRWFFIRLSVSLFRIGKPIDS